MAGRPEYPPRPGHSRMYSSGYESYQPNHRDDSRWDNVEPRPPTGRRRQSFLQQPTQSPSPRAPYEHVNSTNMQNQRKRKATSPPPDVPAPAKQVVTYPTPASRKPAAQSTPGAASHAVPLSILKDSDRLPVQYPSSIEGGRSVRQDDSSGRSTPQPQQIALTTTNAQSVIVELDPIDALHASVAETVSLQVALENYRGDLKKLDAENALFKSVFITNPSLKAARTTARIDKLKQVEACEMLLVQRKATEQQAWQAMWQSLRGPHDAKLHADIYAKISTDLSSRADVVSRADYDILAKSHNDLKNELADQKVILRELQTLFGAVEQVSSRADHVDNTANAKVGQVPNILNRMRDLESTVSANANDVESKVARNLQQISGFSTRLQSLEKVTSDTSTSQREAKTLQNMVREHEQLAKTVNDTVIPKIGRQSNEITTLSKDLESNNTRLDSCTKTCVGHAGSIKRLEDSIERGLSTCKDDNQKIRVECLSISSRVDQLKSSQPRESSKDRQADKDEAKKIKEQLHSVHEQVVQFEARFARYQARFEGLPDRVEELRDEVLEEGKPSVVTRLKRHDQHINNIIASISRLDEHQPKMLKRVDKLETTLLSLEKSLKAIKDSPAAAPPHLTSDPDTMKRVIKLEETLAVTKKTLDEMKERPIVTPPVPSGGTASGESENATILFASIEGLHDLVIKLREKIDGLEDEAGDKDAIVSEEMNNLQNKLSTDIASLDDRIRQQLHVEVDRLTRRHDTMSGDLGTAIAANQKAIGILEASSVAMVEKVQIMERRSTAPPPTTVNGPQQFKPLSRSSPAVQSPRINNLNSPQVNGFHGSSASQQDLDNVKNQCAALTGFCNHLKQRFDNLTTDEMVKNMVGQMSEMYPAAGDFQNAVTRLAQKDRELQDKIENLSNGITNHWNQIKGPLDNTTGQLQSAVKMVTEAKAVAHEAKLSVAEMSGNQFRQQLANIERRVEELSTRSTTSQKGVDDHILKSLPNKLNEQTTAIRKRLDNVEALADKHDKNYGHLPEAFRKANDRISSAASAITILKSRADNAETQAKQQIELTTTLTSKITTLSTAQSTTTISIASLEEMRPKLERLLQDVEHTSRQAQFSEDEVTEIKKLPKRMSVVEKSAEELHVAKGTVAEEFLGLSTKLEDVEERVEEAHGRVEKMERVQGVDGRKAR